MVLSVEVNGIYPFGRFIAVRSVNLHHVNSLALGLYATEIDRFDCSATFLLNARNASIFLKSVTVNWDKPP